MPISFDRLQTVARSLLRILQEACQSSFAGRWTVAGGGRVNLLTKRISGGGRCQASSVNILKNRINLDLAWLLHFALVFFRVPASANPGRTRGERRNVIMASEKLFGLHATALQLRSQRMMMLASNIANAATPHYKARDLDFSKALDLAQQGSSADGAISYRVPVQPSLDGNTVEMATEQTAFAENALAYRSSLSFLQGRVSTLMRSIKGE
jgi:flagellar basal-body rod protein FlgB